MALIPYSPDGGEITLVLVALSKLYIKKGSIYTCSNKIVDDCLPLGFHR